MKTITLIDPSVSSFNLGDEIVSYFLRQELEEIFKDAFFIRVPAYNKFDSRTAEIVGKSDYVFFLGTGPITKEITFRWPIDLGEYKGNVIFFGIGLNSYYDNDLDDKTKAIYNSSLSIEHFHSVRDNFTQKCLSRSLIHNFVNTSCPTLWWTLDYIAVNKDKSDHVLFTVNAARGNFEHDLDLFNKINHNYSRIFFYAQCPNDMTYFKRLVLSSNVKNPGKIEIIPSSLNYISGFLAYNYVDYIGSRLHGGIYAMSKSQRTFIIPVDNRAREIQSDVNLPSITVFDFEEKIYSKFKTEINLPEKDIQFWKDQFHV